MTEIVQKPSDSKCNTASTEPCSFETVPTFASTVIPNETCNFQGVRVRKQNSQRQKKSGCTINKNCEGGGGQGHSIPVSTQSYCGYTLAESLNNTLTAEGSLEASHYPVWLKTSDSDFSDVEAGQAAETRIIQSRVRKSALSLLATVTKVTMPAISWLKCIIQSHIYTIVQINKMQGREVLFSTLLFVSSKLCEKTAVKCIFLVYTKICHVTFILVPVCRM
jgi:hypothetical protein